MLKVVSVCAIFINVFLIGLADSDVTCWKYPASNGLAVSYSNDNKVNSIAKFRCSRGLSLVGSNSSVCQQSGTWSILWPICENPLGCPLNKLASPNLLIEPVKENYHFGDIIELFCLPGHKLIGNIKRVICLGDSWSDDLPGCEKNSRSRPHEVREANAVTCAKFEASPYLVVSYSDDVRVGSTASFQCQLPSMLLGSASAICRRNGTWTHSFPKCEGGCPPKITFPEVFDVFDIYERREELLNIFCEKYDYAWLGKLSGRLHRDGGLLNISFNIEQVIISGIEKAEAIEGETRTLLARDNCTTAMLFPGMSYLILGQDGQNYRDENGDSWYRYPLNHLSIVHMWTSIREAANRQLQRDFRYVTNKLRRDGCSL